MNSIVGKPQTIKKVNKDLIKNIIKDQGPITKPEIANITNLSLATVNKTVQQLLDKNEVKLSGIGESTGGRRAQLFEINADLACIIALYYYNNTIFGVVSNLIGDVIYSEEFKFISSDYENVINDIERCIDNLIESCKKAKVKAIGLGIPGAVKNGVIKNIPNISGLEGINLKKIIEKKYKIKTFIENDVNLATLGIYQKEYKNTFSNMVLLYLEDGIGSGIIINKDLYTGFNNFAGELNIMDIGQDNNIQNSLEQTLLSLKEKIKKAKEQKLKEELLSKVSKVILNIVCILNPEAVIIECEVINKKEIDFIKKYISNLVGADNCPKLIGLESAKEHGINGIINLCLNETTYQYSLSNKKGG